MRSCKSAGFTLVELLVVISIIGVMMSLLLPAVQGAREAARQLQCKNNQKQLAMALQQYESSRKKFPGYVNRIQPDSNVVGKFKVASWAMMLFPYMERNDLWEVWSNYEATFGAGATEPVNDPNTTPMPQVDGLVCPSNPQNLCLGAVQGENWMAYVANTGFIQPGHTRPFRNDQSPWNGVLLAHYDSSDPSAKPIANGMDYVTVNDGASNTLLLSENLQAVKWTWSNLTGSDLGDEKHHYGFCWHDPSGPNQGIREINGDKDKLVINVSDPRDYARPSSFHPGGVIATFCGGQVDFLDENIDYRVYKQLMTPWGKRSFTAGHDPEGNQLISTDDY